MATQEQTILRELQDEMVQRAERLVRNLQLPSRGDEATQKRRTQASRAIEVAQTAGSLSVFINWLRYQAARKDSQDFWGMKVGQKQLAGALAENLSWLQREIGNRMQGESKPEQNRVIMNAATRFLGYFRRALVGADFLDEIALEKGE